MISLLYICVHASWLVGICFGMASPNAKAKPEAHHIDYEIPKYYGYRYGQDVYSPSLYEDPYDVHPISFGHDSYKAKDYGLHTYQSSSYDHKGYPPKGFVSVSYGQKGYGHNSYVHKTIGYDHKGYTGLYSPLHDSPKYGGYVHKGYEHKGSFVGGFGHDVKGYNVDNIGYDGLNNGYDHIAYDKVYKPHSHGNVIFGFAHQNIGLSAHLPAEYKVNESPYSDHLRYGYGQNILSPYSNSYLRR